MTEPSLEPSSPSDVVDSPGHVGAAWWQRSLAAVPSVVSRRAALQGILGGLLAGLGARVEPAGASPGPDTHTELRRAIEMQREYGWSFGAATESLTFDGESQHLFDRSALSRMPEDLRPARLRHAPFYVPTLFQSPMALPRAVPGGDAIPIEPLWHAVRPISTPAMDDAYRSGKALGSLFRGVFSGAMVVVDLPGPQAVAFAAGAADVLDPVFLFDNWPHPRGVTPAHLTLAAAAYYQPLFARRPAPPGAPPMLVLDRSRLDPYTDDAAQFDNRHVARLPGAPGLRAIDVSRVLYVAPTAADAAELDDLNDDFLLYAAAGLDVKIVAADAFGPDPTDIWLPEAYPLGSGNTLPPRRHRDGERRHYYGGSPATHAWFWHDYPWIKPPAGATGKKPMAPSFHRPGAHYTPAARLSAHSTGAHTPAAMRPRPAGFGSVAVVVSTQTGTILGAAMSRSGSWNRASGSPGG